MTSTSIAWPTLLARRQGFRRCTRRPVAIRLAAVPGVSMYTRTEASKSCDSPYACRRERRGGCSPSTVSRDNRHSLPRSGSYCSPLRPTSPKALGAAFWSARPPSPSDPTHPDSYGRPLPQ
jgi:hypothetical protein